MSDEFERRPVVQVKRPDGLDGECHAVRLSIAAHLEWMRDRLGDRFLTGVVFHTGPSAFALADKISALPIASLWLADRAT